MNRSRYDFDLERQVMETAEPIAIIGASCRLPGAPDVESFWRMLLDGIDAVTEIPDDRWNKAALFHPERGQRGKAYTFAAGVLGDVSGFDPAFFGISPREATQMDPQQRLLLELAYEAIEDAGQDSDRLRGEPVGVFVGGSSWDYLNLNVGDPSTTDAYSMIGVTLSILSNRISYAFDLRGPSFTVDTACSSSLVALHQACESIRRGESGMALVGGVSLLLAPQSFVGFCAASMLSPKGRCHAFDARADGYVRAEGGGMVLLKPLGAALAAGDPIRAVIRGTGVNSDGRTSGLSLPNKAAQAALLSHVYGRFGVDPADLAYVEAHGTGTPAGDPIEAGAIGAVLGRGRATPLPIGSVKTNIGHLEAGSGMAGLLKAMLVAERGVIPPSLHCETPNPNIPFAELGLTLVPEAIALPEGTKRLVGLNSFGFGGTNAHAVLEAPDRIAPPASEPLEILPPLLLSARSAGALKVLAAAWRDRLASADPGTLPAIVRGQAFARTQHKKRLVVPGGAATAMVEALDAFLTDKPTAAVATNDAVTTRIGYVFSGNGSQWVGMAADAMAGSAAFREGLIEADTALRPWLGWSVAEALADPDADALRNTDVAQPLLFAVQVALVLALREHGVAPDACMGHSVGEVAAAWASGALDLDAAARVIAARSSAQQQQHGVGAMGVLGFDAAASAAVLSTPPLAGAGVEVAAHNSGQATTVAGSAGGMAALEAEAKAKGWRFTRLDLDYAFHSAAMDPIEERLHADLAGLAPGRTHVPFFSTVSGVALDGTALDATYWWRNVRAPVLFAEAARAMVAEDVRLFVEVGPHPVVQSYLTEALRAADKEGRVLPTLGRRPIKGDPIALLAARIHAAGGDIRRADAFAGAAVQRGLPAYPWQRERFWVERTPEATDLVTVGFDHPLLGRRQSDQPVEWRQHLSLETHPWIADHVVGGAAVVPAAALIEIALGAARERHPKAAALDLMDVEISRALVIEPHVAREVRFRVGSDAGDFELASRPRLSEEAWIVHMRGRIGENNAPPPSVSTSMDVSVARRLNAEALYVLARGMGLDYGPAFQVVSRIDMFDDMTAFVHLGDVAHLIDGLLLAPNRVDGALQGLLALTIDRLGGGDGVMPRRFGRVQLLAPAGAIPVSARLDVTQVGPRSIRADITLLDADGSAVVRLTDCWFVQVTLARSARMDDMFFHPANVASKSVGEIPFPMLPGPALDEIMPNEGRLLADAYAAATAAETVRTLAAGRPDFLPQALIHDGVVASGSRVVLDRLLRWLSADGLAKQGKDGIWSLQVGDLPPSDAILRTLFYDFPRAVADTALLALAGDALPALLRNGPDAAHALPAALWDQFLTGSPSSAEAASALADRVRDIAAEWPAGRPLRILEIGARRGALTRHVLRVVTHPDLVLTAATGSEDQPALAEQLHRDPRARAIAWTPGGGPIAGSFDLVIGLHALSLMECGIAEIAAILPMLSSGGALLLAEPAPSRTWQLLQPFARALVDGGRRLAMIEEAGFVEAGAQGLSAGLWPMVLLTARVAATSVVQTEIRTKGSFTLFASDGPDTDALAAALGDAIDDTHDFGALSLMVAKCPDPVSLILMPGDGVALAERLAAIATLSRLPAGDAPWPVTLAIRGLASGDDRAAALMGACRVLANEAPHVACRLVRIAPELSTTEAIACLASEIMAPDAETDVAWSTSGRTVPRVRKRLAPLARSGDADLRMTVQRPGLLDSLGWTGITAESPGSGQVAIKVEAAGLNFRDVMWAMGLLPDEALLDGFAGPTLGLECSGTIVAAGEGVTAFAPGDRVMAFAPASLSTNTVTAAHAVMRMPADMTFTAAATVPVAFLTVAYALGHLGQLGTGETVLIHGGAGGVGLAAIQYARHRGARIFATAGSPAKRALLRSLGVDAVFDSRSLAFADEVMRLTGGAGVDVVLNSLSGEAMRRSLGLVKPFGRFLELGKRDFYENSAIGLRPFRHNVSYFGIDADQLPLRRPALAAALFGEISDLFAAGALRALPHRIYDYADAEDAFRLMQVSGHIGKIVLVPGVVPPAVIPSPASFVARADATYIVTGGLDGFGLEAARWLARHGARRLALLGRRGPDTPRAAAVLAAFAEDGVDARAYAVDVAEEAALARVLDAIRTDQGVPAGVVHAAVVMDDALLGRLDAARFERALRPKLLGAEALDRLTRQDPIDLFVLFSSVTTPLGNPGQANYVAANAAIEALAERRHAGGLPALAVQWGPVGDTGYLAREVQVSDMLARMLGGSHLSAIEALDQLPMLLAAGLPVAGIAAVRWGSLRSRLPLLASPLFSEMDEAGADEAAEVDLKGLLATCSPEEAQRRITAMLVDEVARIIKLAPERIEARRPLAELGMDSLMAVELRLAVEQRFGISIPLLALSEGATLAAMAGRIVRSLGGADDGRRTDAIDELAQRLARHESAVIGPADGVTAPPEPGLAAAAAAMP